MHKKSIKLPHLDEIRAMVRTRPPGVTLEMLATAAGVSRDWVKEFLSEDVAAPGYPYVAAIYEFLSARQG